MNIHSRNFWGLSCIVLKNSCFSLVNNIYTQDKYQLLNQINDYKNHTETLVDLNFHSFTLGFIDVKNIHSTPVATAIYGAM